MVAACRSCLCTGCRIVSPSSGSGYNPVHHKSVINHFTAPAWAVLGWSWPAVPPVPVSYCYWPVCAGSLQCGEKPDQCMTLNWGWGIVITATSNHCTAAALQAPAIQIQIQMNSANSARSCWSGYIGNQRIRASRNEFVCLNNLKSELESAKLWSCELELDCWKIWTFLATSWELGRSLQYFYTGTKQQQHHMSPSNPRLLPGLHLHSLVTGKIIPLVVVISCS